MPELCVTGASGSQGAWGSHPEVPTLMGSSPRLVEVNFSVACRNCCTDLSSNILPIVFFIINNVMFYSLNVIYFRN